MKNTTTMRLYLISISVFLLFSCSAHMSVEEAKKVTTSFVGKGFTPPPRKIIDITKILSRNEPTPENIQKKIALANSDAQKGLGEKKLAIFYYKRAEAKLNIGVPSLADYQKSYALVKKKKQFLKTRKGFMITWNLGKREFAEGSVRRGLALMELAKKNFSKADATGLVQRYAGIGDFKAAERAKEYTIKKRQQKNKNKKNKTINLQEDMNISIVTAEILELRGKYEKAEPYRRSALAASYQLTKKNAFWPVYMKTELSKNLMKQQRLLEAEIEARHAIKEGLKISEKSRLARTITTLSIILAKQDRLEESEQLIRKLLVIMKQAGYPENSINIARINYRLGQILVAQEKWDEALVFFKNARKVLKESLQYGKFFLSNEDFGLTLIKTGHLSEGEQIFHEAYLFTKKNRGKSSIKAKRMLAFTGVANAEARKYKTALKYFQKSIPDLLKLKNDQEMNKMKIVKRRALLDGYINFLIRTAGTDLEKKYDINALDEAFRIADISRSQSVQAALAKSGVRASISDPDLADYSRREQDAHMQVQALKSSLSAHYALPEKEQSLPVIKKLKKDINLLENAQIALGIEIEKEFPGYAELSVPKPVDIATVQKSLKQGEAMISFFVTKDKTYIWAIPEKGSYAFATADTGKSEIEKAVETLRSVLDVPVATFGEIPEFDVQTAHWLYRKLLKPVERGWKESKQLIVVGHEALNQIPFSLFVTESVLPGNDPHELFSKYKKVPWLIKRVAITNIPSAIAFASLRSSTNDFTDSKLSFVGFGDPLFNADQEGPVAPEPLSTTALKSRGIRIIKNGSLDHNKSGSITLDMLQRLPDTSEEVLSIALTLGADPVKDVFLQKRANEQLVKTMDMSDRKVILFSTHALVPGDIDGLTQPAIALSSPVVTGNNEDGLLTMDEIMGLRLNAEWVVLSACNTAAASGKGAEAVSGLGRAFFYAGTRAVLVSNWAVETTSASELVTALFRNSVNRLAGSRSHALRQAELGMITKACLTDAKTNKKVVSYAHPFFWAPFTLVGDGH